MRFGGGSFGGLTVLPGHYMDHYWGGCLMALNGRERGDQRQGSETGGGDLHRQKDVNVV